MPVFTNDAVRTNAVTVKLIKLSLTQQEQVITTELMTTLPLMAMELAVVFLLLLMVNFCLSVTSGGTGYTVKSVLTQLQVLAQEQADKLMLLFLLLVVMEATLLSNLVLSHDQRKTFI